MNQHTDYMLFFIIHVESVPLLESVQEKWQRGGMKREMAENAPSAITFNYLLNIL